MTIGKELFKKFLEINNLPSREHCLVILSKEENKTLIKAYPDDDDTKMSLINLEKD